jgi:hypothetical protein
MKLDSFLLDLGDKKYERHLAETAERASIHSTFHSIHSDAERQNPRNESATRDMICREYQT